jgi:hypothetical protein
MMFQDLTVAATVRILCNAYLYSCAVLMGLSYVGYIVVQHAERSPKHSHWFS